MSDTTPPKRKPTRPLKYSVVRAFKCTEEEAERLDVLAEALGSKSQAVREGLVLLDRKLKRKMKRELNG